MCFACGRGCVFVCLYVCLLVRIGLYLFVCVYMIFYVYLCIGLYSHISANIYVTLCLLVSKRAFGMNSISKYSRYSKELKVCICMQLCVVACTACICMYFVCFLYVFCVLASTWYESHK